MKTTPLFFFLLIIFASCDNMSDRMKANRGGYTTEEKKALAAENSFNDNQNVDSLDKVYGKASGYVVSHIMQHDGQAIYALGCDNFKELYKKKDFIRYVDAAYNLFGQLKSTKPQDASYDYDGTNDLLTRTATHMAKYERTDGDITSMMVYDDDYAELLDLSFTIDEMEKITPLKEKLTAIFNSLKEKKFADVYNNASDRFKELNYPNYFETLNTEVGEISFDNMIFTEGLLKLDNETGNVILEVGFSRKTYDGFIIDFIVQPNGELLLNLFDYEP